MQVKTNKTTSVVHAGRCLDFLQHHNSSFTKSFGILSQKTEQPWKKFASFYESLIQAPLSRII